MHKVHQIYRSLESNGRELRCRTEVCYKKCQLEEVGRKNISKAKVETINIAAKYDFLEMKYNYCETYKHCLKLETRWFHSVLSKIIKH